MKFGKILSVILAVLLLACAVFAVNGFADYTENGITYVPQGSGYAVKKISALAGSAVVIPSQADGKAVIAVSNDACRNNDTVISVTVPSSVKTVGEYAFSACPNLKSADFESGSGNVTLRARLFADCSSLESVTLPATASVPSGCFSNCTSLGNVEIPKTVQRIGDESFIHCSSMTAVKIPAGVEEIGNSAFYNCSGVTAYTVDPANTAYKAAGGVLYTADGSTLVQYPTGNSPKSFNVPEGTEAIADGAFAGCTIGHITLPSTLKEIGSYAFCDCSALSLINFPNGLETIGSNAFLRCYALKTADLPGTLTSFDEAFSDCGLETVTIGEGVKAISPNAFKSCKKLRSVKLPSTLENIMYGAFYGCVSLSEIEIPESVTSIGSNAFYGCDSLTIKGKKGSYAETYAAANSIPFAESGSQPGQQEEEPAVAIAGYTGTLSVGYKTTVTFHANVSGSTDYTLVWVAGGRQYTDNGSRSFTYGPATGSYSVKCVVTANGKTAESQTENVSVSTNIFAKIVYFFRSIFAPAKLNIDQT